MADRKICKVCGHKYINTCSSCAKIGSKNPMFGKIYPHDLSGRNNPNYKNSNRKCIDCGKELTTYLKRVDRCRKCYRLWVKIPENNPMFGKLTYVKRIYYNETCMRSSYEVNFARFLDLSGYKWKYESKTFNLGNMTYTPDFYIPEWNSYIEIKGWFHGKTKEKFEKFRQVYPEINIKLLKKENLQEIGVL